MDYEADHPFSFPIVKWKPDNHEELTTALVDNAYKLKNGNVKGAVLSHGWRNATTREMNLVDDKDDYEKHGYSSYRSGISLFADPYIDQFKDLHDAAFQACYRYINASNWDKPDADLDNLGLLNHAWVSIYGNGHFIPEHVHTDSHLSWVFYGASDGDTGKIIFRNPAAPVFRMSYQEDAELFFETWKLPPEVGCFYVFPSFMSHWTEQHLGDDDRIIYSGNFVFTRSVTGHGTLHRTSRVADESVGRGL